MGPHEFCQKTISLLDFGLLARKVWVMFAGKNFSDRLAESIRRRRSILCVGLDFQLDFMPPHLVKELRGSNFDDVADLFEDFGCKIIGLVADVAACVKINAGFCLQYGHYGVRALERILKEARSFDLPAIVDLKPNDGGDSATAYANTFLGEVPWFGGKTRKSPLRADALTVVPYLGTPGLEPSYVRACKEYGTGIFVLDKTSFKGGSEVQDASVEGKEGAKVWELVADLINKLGQDAMGECGLSSVGAVVGATFPEEAEKARKRMPKAWWLVPGYGKQGGGPKAAVVGVNPDGLGAVVNSSRGVIYCYLDKDGKLRCQKSEQCFDLIRQQAIDDRDFLAQACDEQGKWPF